MNCFRRRARQADHGLLGHRAVRDDNIATVIRFQDGETKRDFFDNAGFELAICRCRNLEAITSPEGFVENQADPGDQITQRGLRGEANDHRHEADPGEKRRAEAIEIWHEMSVERRQHQPKRKSEQSAKKREGDRVDTFGMLAEEQLLQTLAYRPREHDAEYEKPAANGHGA